ncbi:MAG: SusD/RagB family nutrient-binding outer membrane lipoprotein, partial [Chitinophagaceae bacterium]
MKQVLISIVILLSISSCKKFLDVNEDPNKPVSGTLPLKAKFPAALVSTMNQESGQLNQIGALWGGYWGTNNDGIATFIDLKTYNGPALRHQRDGIPVWEDSYTNLMYYELIREEAVAANMHFYAGAARIMQAWHFLRLVDFYNNVPFEDALKGTREATPAYEDGKTVYDKSLALITQGIEDIKNTIPGSEAGSDDILFQGDKSRWIRFANTIKLRAFLRQSETDNLQYVTTEIQKIVQEGSGFLGVGESALVNPGYLLTAGKMNPLWETFYRSVQG